MKVRVTRLKNDKIGIQLSPYGMLRGELSLNEALALIGQLFRITNDMRYEVWLGKVQAVVNAIVPVDLNDLSDFCYRDAFEAHESPRETARHVLDDNGYGYDFDE